MRQPETQSEGSRSNLVYLYAENAGPGRRQPRYKRPLDLLLLTSAHLLLAPVWVLLWTLIPIAIWLNDRGPIFYPQRRIGRGGRVFTVRKFRSMVPDAERMTGSVWSIADDPRITPVGRLLRHTALDELPQVINMWKGEMSIVGPRPERPELHRQIVDETPQFAERLTIAPGLTGMAQVYGEYDSPPAQKLVYDLEYIQKMGLLLDLKLILLSVKNTLLARWDRPKQVDAQQAGPEAESHDDSLAA